MRRAGCYHADCSNDLLLQLLPDGSVPHTIR